MALHTRSSSFRRIKESGSCARLFDSFPRGEAVQSSKTLDCPACFIKGRFRDDHYPATRRGAVNVIRPNRPPRYFRTAQIPTAAMSSCWPDCRCCIARRAPLYPLCAKISETPSLPGFSVEGGEGNAHEEVRKRCSTTFCRFGLAWCGAE